MKKMKKFLAVLLSVVMMLGCFSATAFAEDEITLPFTDVKEGSFYYEAVLRLYEYGTIRGKTATTFAPGEKVTRAEFAVMLYREIHDDLEQGDDISKAYSAKFKDVPAGQWYTDAVIWCANAGLITGYTSGAKAGYYGVSDLITREQMVTMLERAENVWWEDSTILYKDISGFPDAGKVSSWAKGAMQYAVGFKIITGIAHGNVMYLEPQTKVSRAQAAVMLFRWIDNTYDIDE